MKNIHVLPTNKPSRLLKDLVDETYQLKKEVSYGNRFELPLNIYITSDEYIGLSYYLDGNLVRKGVVDDKDYWEVRQDYKKIILTTDQDLIKDGVQAIPDEFLEWFVKNPECKEVKVKHKEIIQYGNMTMYDHNGDGSHYFCKDCEVETSRSKEELLKFGAEYYKIIIPKEEPKLKNICIKCGVDLYATEGRFECQKHPKECKGIILPKETLQEWADKEEQKQHLIDMMKADEELELYEEPKQETLDGPLGRDGISDPELNETRLDIPKQETLQKSLDSNKQFIKNKSDSELNDLMGEFDNYKVNESTFTSIENELIKEAKKVWEESHPNPIEMALFGAKWQAERMYSEEEVENILNERWDILDLWYNNSISEISTTAKWFEQFKKK